MPSISTHHMQVRGWTLFKGLDAAYKMNSNLLKNVEIECCTKTFEESTKGVPQFKTQLSSWPSEIIQARISFDAACRMDLSTMTPLQMQRLAALKRELIQTLHGQY